MFSRHCPTKIPKARTWHVARAVAMLSLLAGPVAGLIANLPVTALAAQEEDGPPAVANPDVSNPAVKLVNIRLPLTGDAGKRYEAVLARAVDSLVVEGKKGNDRPTLVLEFTPAALPKQASKGEAGRGTKYLAALELAHFLTSAEVAGVKTIAYLPQSVKGHAVLVVLACEEIAIAPDAEFGAAGIDEPKGQPIGSGILEEYQRTARARRNVPEEVAASLVDRDREVLRVETEDRIDFVSRGELEELEKTRTIVSQDVLTPSGSFSLFTGRQARDYGFARSLVRDKRSLAETLETSPESLEEDESLIAEWRPVMIDIIGPITPRMARQVATLIGTELDTNDVNWIGFRIDSAGGELESTLRIAQEIAALARQEVQTVAYVPVEATGEAALVALACDRLVMQPAATVGGKRIALAAKPKQPDAARKMPPPGAKPAPGDQPADEQAADDQADQIASDVASVREGLRDLTERSWSLFAATVDPNLAVYEYTNRETGETQLYSEAEAAEQPDAAAWQRGEAITTPGEPLRLNAERAEQLGIAWRTVETFDELRRIYGFEGEVRVAEPNWALEFVEALASPQLAVLLLMVGFVGIYIELNAPGVGIGGFIAAVAFLLFFWSKFTAQTADWLEVMLFLGGLVFILLEVLVLPGFGIFGLGGVGLVLASLVLASQTFILPKTESQLAELRGSLGVVSASLLAFLVAGFFLRRYLPSSPLFRKMLLAPPAAEELAELQYRETVADYTHLIGQTGKATTPLLPSGRAEIDGELVDVVTDGSVVDRGEAVVVVSARGSRVVVRKA